VTPDKTQKPRLGPRPLPLHLAAAAATWTSSLGALQLLRSGSLDWKPELRETARDLRNSLAGIEPKEADAAVQAEARRRLSEFIDGILAYRRHPYRRTLADPPSVWAEGAMRLLDYGATANPPADGAPVLVVPSLINRAYILDLSERKSLLRYLAAQGLRPFLADWGWPGPRERNFGLSDYIGGALEEMLDKVREITGRKPVVLGYCMGGLLALALAALRPRDVSGLVLLATPWDFHSKRGEQARLAAAFLGPLEPVIERFGELPVDMLQAMFASLDPLGAARKFCAFAALAGGSERGPASQARVEEFVALEDWLNDGVPLVGRVARECLGSWYGANDPALGRWRVAGKVIDPKKLRCPTLVVIPAQDRIVPPESAEPLVAGIPGAERMTPPLGHIGMVVGSRAESMLWQPLAAWIAEAGKAPSKPRKSATPSGAAKARRSAASAPKE
jgi:polyhydroxyalkanoate synthase